MLDNQDYAQLDGMSRRSGLDRIGTNYLTSHANASALPSQAVNTAHQYQDAVYGAAAAADAPFGSIEKRFDPNAFGSIASRQFGGTFGPSGSLNPEYQQEQQQQQAHQQRVQQAGDSDALARRTGQYTAGFMNPFFQQMMSTFGRPAAPNFSNVESFASTKPAEEKEET